MKEKLFKLCIVSGKKYIKPSTCPRKEWVKRICCSKDCNYRWRKGKHFGIKTEFKKGHTFLKGRKFPGRKARSCWERGHIPWNKGRKWTEEERRRISDGLPKRFGEKAANWRGGMTDLRIAIDSLKKSSGWRKDVFKRDNYTCQNCGQYGYKLQIHHIKPIYQIIREYKIKTTQDAIGCSHLWDRNNGQTLCISCHKQTDSYLVNQHTLV